MPSQDFLRDIFARAGRCRRRIVLAEGGDARVAAAAARAAALGVAEVVLVGAGDETTAAGKAAGVDLPPAGLPPAGAAKIEVVDCLRDARAEKYAAVLWQARRPKGMTLVQARAAIRQPLIWAVCMVRCGDADGCVAGAAHTTAEVVRAALQVVGAKSAAEYGQEHGVSDEPGDGLDDGHGYKHGGGSDREHVSRDDAHDDADNLNPKKNHAPAHKNSLVSSFFVMQHGLAHQALRGPAVFADCALVVAPSAEQLARIAMDCCDSAATLLGLKPRVALLSFSTAGSARHPYVDKVRAAGAIIARRRPHLELMAEVQFDAAVMPDILRRKAPDITIAAPANVFIFPDLQSANIGYKIAERIGRVTAVGPILQGLNRPVNDLSRGCAVEDIVALTAVTAVQAQAQRAGLVSS